MVLALVPKLEDVHKSENQSEAKRVAGWFKDRYDTINKRVTSVTTLKQEKVKSTCYNNIYIYIVMMIASTKFIQ